MRFESSFALCPRKAELYGELNAGSRKGRKIEYAKTAKTYCIEKVDANTMPDFALLACTPFRPLREMHSCALSNCLYTRLPHALTIDHRLFHVFLPPPLEDYQSPYSCMDIAGVGRKELSLQLVYFRILEYTLLGNKFL